MARHHMKNGIKVPFTKAEEDAQDLVDEAWITDTPNRKWKMIREERNRYLAKTDWTQQIDTPQSIKDAFATYREQLRDLPQTYPDDFEEIHTELKNDNYVKFPKMPKG